MKLNLGCGGDLLPGYINCDKYYEKADIICDVNKLPFEDNSVEEIFACHIIEHFDFREAFVVLEEWKRVLKDGGLLIVETPDLLETCRAFINASEDQRIALYGHLFSTPWVSEGLIHKFLYTETQLGGTLKSLGFRDVKRVLAQSGNNQGINLRMEGIK
jgi:predicted SAM-dependent methyltransferase